MLQQNAAKTKDIIELRNEVCSLEQRTTLQERYSSKDSLIFENLPWDGKQSSPDFITSFLGEYLNFQTNPGNFKACHVLGRGQLNYAPAVIVNFIYFHEKNETFGRKNVDWCEKLDEWKTNFYKGETSTKGQRITSICK